MNEARRVTASTADLRRNQWGHAMEMCRCAVDEARHSMCCVAGTNRLELTRVTNHWLASNLKRGTRMGPVARRHALYRGCSSPVASSCN